MSRQRGRRPEWGFFRSGSDENLGREDRGSGWLGNGAAESGPEAVACKRSDDGQSSTVDQRSLAGTKKPAGEAGGRSYFGRFR